MKKCTNGTRHKWQFVKNVIIREETRTSVTLSKRGSYKCECGERKIGAYRMEQEPTP
jgi:hypothetical protein